MKRKIINQYIKTTNEQTNDLDSLRKINILTSSNAYFKKPNELVLLDKHLITNGYNKTGVQFRTKFIFENLNEKDLHNIHPYSFLETSSGFADYHNPGWPAWYVFSSVWWQTYQDKIILHLIADGYLYYNRESDLCPIYLTAKILIYNPILFDFTIKKTS